MSSSLLEYKKPLQSRLFIFPFVQRFLGFYEQRYTLGGLLLPYRFVVNSFLYDSYPMGRSSASTSLMPQLVQAVILPQHDAFVDSKGLGNLLRISYVSLTNLHTQHDASAEIDPPAGLSSNRIPALDIVWYHAPWWRRYRRYKRYGLLLFGRLLW